MLDLIRSILEILSILENVHGRLKNVRAGGKALRQQILNCSYYRKALEHLGRALSTEGLCSDARLVLLLKLVAQVARRVGFDEDLRGFRYGLTRLCGERSKENAWCRYMICKSLGVKFDERWHRHVMERIQSAYERSKPWARNPDVELIRIALKGDKARTSFGAECATTWQNVCEDIRRCLEWALQRK